jgi:hypothetical protein
LLEDGYAGFGGGGFIATIMYDHERRTANDVPSTLDSILLAG